MKIYFYFYPMTIYVNRQTLQNELKIIGWPYVENYSNTYLLLYIYMLFCF